MIIGLSIGSSVLGAVLILFGCAVGGIVVFGSGSGVQATALRVDTGVSTLQDQQYNALDIRLEICD